MAALLACLGVLPLLLGLDGILVLVLGPGLGITSVITWWRTRKGLLATPARATELEWLLAGLPRASVNAST